MSSRLVLALDETDPARALDIAKEVSPFVSKIKINYPLVLSAGLDIVTEICRKNISNSAWNAMQTIFKENIEECLSFPLKNVMYLFNHILCDDPDWKCNANRFSEIRLLKLLFQKIYVDEQTKSDIILCD